MENDQLGEFVMERGKDCTLSPEELSLMEVSELDPSERTLLSRQRSDVFQAGMVIL